MRKEHEYMFYVGYIAESINDRTSQNISKCFF